MIVPAVMEPPESVMVPVVCAKPARSKTPVLATVTVLAEPAS